MHIAIGYGPRQIEFAGIWQFKGWRIKQYTIAYGDQAERCAPLLATARTHAAGVLPPVNDAPGWHGVGFMGAHAGRDADFIFIDWWSHENELHHVAWIARRDDPVTGLRMIDGSGPIACVWDLAIIAFERQAWIDHVLRPRATSADAYLAMTFEGAT
jgi:hypothetical protein